ncbi:hypothetical protein BH11ACT3_BH11ACT3_12520 [soil metagenome]
MASADVASDGLWYFDDLHVQEALDSGADGRGITVAVIDSPINLSVPTLVGADISVSDAEPCYLDGEKISSVSDDISVATHGTNVASLIVGSGAGYGTQLGLKGVAPGVSIRYYIGGDFSDKHCRSEDGELSDDLPAEIKQAVKDGADIISMSIVAGQSDALVDAIAQAEREGVILVFGLTNHNNEAAGWTPTANGVVSVQAADRDANILSTDGTTPNFDPAVDVVAPGVGILLQGSENAGKWEQLSIGRGTSYATPIVAGFLADVWSKYPNATSNQLIQTLIHNTGTEDHELTYEEKNRGYGFVSLTHMLIVDPTQYPDANPLLIDSAVPSKEQIFGSATSKPSSPATGEPSSSGYPLTVVLGLVGALILLLVVLAIVVFARRHSRKKSV